MRSLIGIGLVALVLTGSTYPAIGSSFDGWCFVEDECAGPSKIKNGAFITCESNCRLTRPTNVEGMDGILYDVLCESDEGSLDRPRKERMLLMRYKDYEGKIRALAVGQDGAQELAKCDDRY